MPYIQIVYVVLFFIALWTLYDFGKATRGYDDDKRKLRNVLVTVVLLMLVSFISLNDPNRFGLLLGRVNP